MAGGSSLTAIEVVTEKGVGISVIRSRPFGSASQPVPRGRELLDEGPRQCVVAASAAPDRHGVAGCVFAKDSLLHDSILARLADTEATLLTRLGLP